LNPHNKIQKLLLHGGTPVTLVSEAIETEHSPGHIVIEVPEEILPEAGLESLSHNRFVTQFS